MYKIGVNLVIEMLYNKIEMAGKIGEYPVLYDESAIRLG